ncbi:MAG: hypothetical protein V4580_11675 [Bacteroidota bacterium]
MRYLNRIQIRVLKKLLSLLLCVIANNIALSQRDTLKEEPYVYFNGTSVITGFSLSEHQSHTQDYFKLMAPKNSIISTMAQNVEKRANTDNSGNARINFGLNLHLKTKDFKTKLTTFSSEWRIGLNVSTNIRESYTCSKKTLLPTDTFYSNHPPLVIDDPIIDSIYQFSYHSNNAYLDLTKTYHTNQQKWLSFYTGINFGLGYSYNNSLTVESAVDTSKNGDLREKYYRVGRFYNVSTETTQLNSELFYSVSIPAGAILRAYIRSKGRMLRLAFFAEGRFGYRFQKMHTDTYKSTPLGTVQIGFKLYFKR